MDKGNRDLPIYKSWHNRMTVLKCSHLCSAHRHFGLQHGKYCWCGDTFGKWGIAAETDCKMECLGEPSMKCGGRYRNSLYSHKTQQALAQVAQVYYEPLFEPNAGGVNLARGKPTNQSTVRYSGESGRAVDGNIGGNYGHGSCTHTDDVSFDSMDSTGPWWHVDLQAITAVSAVRLWNRDHSPEHLAESEVFLGNSTDYSQSATKCGEVLGTAKSGANTIQCGGSGRYVHVVNRFARRRRRVGTTSLTLTLTLN